MNYTIYIPIQGGVGFEKKLGLLAMVVALMAITAGCSEVNQPITPKSTEFGMNTSYTRFLS